MKRRTVILLVIFGLIMIAAVAVFGSTALAILRAQAWKEDPSLALETAHTIIDYDLPKNYQERQVLVVQGAPLGVIISHRDHPVDLIALLPLPSGILENEAWRTKYEEKNSRTVGTYRYETQTIINEPITVRGQSANLRILEGKDQNGVTIRQGVCLFEGKQGELMLIYVTEQSRWDRAVFDDFIQSIR